MALLLLRRRDERLAENQQMFRHANERLRERIIDAGASDHRHIPFLCECAEEACRGRIDATLDVDERAGALPQEPVLLAPGHRRIASEETIEENRR